MNKVKNQLDEIDVFSKGRGLIAGYAAIRGIDSEGNIAIFCCPGGGSDDYHFRLARQKARRAGFKPLDEIWSENGWITAHGEEILVN